MRRTVMAALRRFLGDQRGNAIVEGTLMVPLLAMAWVGTYAFWDAFDAKSAAEKAVYTAADIVSRENVPLTTTFLDGIDNALEYLIGPRFDTTTRYTSFRRSGPTDTEVTVLWSYSTGAALPVLTTADLQAKASTLPKLAVGTTAILVENRMGYTLPFGVPLPDFVAPSGFTDQIVVRPRFAAKLCLTGAASC